MAQIISAYFELGLTSTDCLFLNLSIIPATMFFIGAAMAIGAALD